jgi:hypothetical protein
MNDAPLPGVQTGLGAFYLLLALMNFGFAAWLFARPQGKGRLSAALWGFVGALAVIHSIAYFAHAGWTLPLGVRESVDGVLKGNRGATIYVIASVVAFAVALWFRKFFVRPEVAWAVLMISLFAAGWAMTDPNFLSIVAKPDNVPISMLIFSVGFFTWVGMSQAVRNDERIARGEPVWEKLDDEKVLVWPDLVYTELIAMVVATVVLVVWAILLKAPLEQPATTARAPNPSKAPWYFLGLQEMLVYFDPWMAGVVLPTFIIIGLVAMPYIDFNQRGNGYFSFKERWFAVTTFDFGFLVLWVTLIVLGTFLRGPNWNFFAFFEPWDSHMVLPLNNVNLSELFWLHLMHQPLEGMNPVVRELPGFILVGLYLFALPPLLARTLFRTFFVKMGFVRFMVLVVLLQFMASLPIKMVLRWTINLKYIVYLPEIFFNI